MANGPVFALIAILTFVVSHPATAQQDEAKEEGKKSIKDYLDVYYHDPAELGKLWQEAERSKPLIGPLGLGGYYIPPSQEPGSYYGPPLQIWGRGFGTSLWRNPITGWPIQ
ncbi:MAG TPA: hypothetical protein VGC53_06685 [Vicinamibacteria bacterium]|jgi:hypothetical protein